MFSEFHRGALAQAAIEALQVAFGETQNFTGDLRNLDQFDIETARHAVRIMLLGIFILLDRDKRRGRPGVLMELMHSCKFDELQRLLAYANLVIPPPDWAKFASGEHANYDMWREAYPPFLAQKRP